MALGCQSTNKHEYLAVRNVVATSASATAERDIALTLLSGTNPGETGGCSNVQRRPGRQYPVGPEGRVEGEIVPMPNQVTHSTWNASQRDVTGESGDPATTAQVVVAYVQQDR